MKPKRPSPETEAALWARIIHPDGPLSPQAARAILQLAFPESDRQRMHILSAKARAGRLTPDEESDMDLYERAGALLSVLQSRARMVLRKRRRPVQPG